MTLSDYNKTMENLIDETALLMFDPNNERFIRPRVQEAVNDAVLEMCLEAQLVHDEINIQLFENTVEYDIVKQIEENGSKKEYAFPVRIGYNGDENPSMWPTDYQVIDNLMVNDINLNFSEMDDFRPHSRWSIDLISPGLIEIYPAPNTDGDSSTEDGNMQVLYVGFPTYMDSEDDSPDSNVQEWIHQGIPYGAAYRLSDESNNMSLATAYEGEFIKWIRRAIKEFYRNQTVYDDARPA